MHFIMPNTNVNKMSYLLITYERYVDVPMALYPLYTVKMPIKVYG